jgi:dihydrofolate reductase
MRKLKLYLHTTIDGFVAGANGEMDWIHVDDEIFDYTSKLTETSDTYLMGRKTFDMMEGYWPSAGKQANASKHDINHSNWYNRVPKVIISKTLKDKNIPNTNIISENLPEQIITLKKQSGDDIIIFGSPSTAHSLMENNLIDEYGLFINPLILGIGIPYFKKFQKEIKLDIVDSKLFSSGVVALRYLRK